MGRNMSTENQNIKINIDSPGGDCKNIENNFCKKKIQEKIEFFFKIITETIVSIEKYKTNDIISASELNLCIQNLENIYSDLKNIENFKSNSNQIILKLQTINDELSSVFKNFGTSKIANILTVCYGNDFVNSIENTLDSCKLDLILNFIQPISYKILPWKNPPKIKNKFIEDFMIVEMGKTLDCFDLCRTSNNFYTKVFGIKVIFQNKEKKNTIIISGVVTELLLSCLKNKFIDNRIQNCIKNKPKDNEFNSTLFKTFITHIS